MDSRRLSPRLVAVAVLTATAARATLKSQPHIIDNEQSVVGSLASRAVHSEGATNTMLKNMLFYTVAGTVIALVLQAVGAGSCRRPARFPDRPSGAVAGHPNHPLQQHALRPSPVQAQPVWLRRLVITDSDHQAWLVQ